MCVCLCVLSSSIFSLTNMSLPLLRPSGHLCHGLDLFEKDQHFFQIKPTLPCALYRKPDPDVEPGRVKNGGHSVKTSSCEYSRKIVNSFLWLHPFLEPCQIHNLNFFQNRFFCYVYELNFLNYLKRTTITSNVK